MKLLFTTTGHPGHVLPLVPLARACLRAGHEVRVAGPRSRSEIVLRADVPFWAFDDPPADEVGAAFAPALELPPEEANALVIGEVFGRLATAAALPGVLGMIEAWRPDVVVRESYEFASAVAAERAGVPHVRVATGLRSTEEWLLGHARADVPAEAIRASPLISFTPPGFDDGPVTHRFRTDAPPARSDGRFVYVTFGSVAGGMPIYPRLYRDALDALGDLPVLMTVGHHADPAALGPLPANARVERWVDQAEIAPHAAAMVVHGGYGTTIGALAAGVPLVVAPLFADQGRNAARVAEVGAGVALPMPARLAAGADLAGLGEMVRRVLEEPSYRGAAREIAASAAALPSVDAVPGVLAAIAGRRVAA